MHKQLFTSRDDLFVIRNFISDEACEAFIAKAHASGFDEATVNSFGGPIVNKGMRDNSRVILDDLDTAAWLWQRIEPFVNDVPFGSRSAVGLNERFRYYRYTPGQFFDWHFDGAFRRNAEEVSCLTFMIYLNGDYTGGTTDFSFQVGTIREDDPIVTVKPERGMALLFTHDVLHRGSEVHSGVKYVLRSDVMYRRG